MTIRRTIAQPSVKLPQHYTLLNVLTNSNFFIKVGITTPSVAARIRNNGTINYDIQGLNEHALDLYDAFALEQTILDMYHSFVYNPGEYFQRKTECLPPSRYSQITKTIQENKNGK